MPSPEQPLEYQLSIDGMTCQHCVGRALEAAKSVAGVSKVEISLENNSASITGGIPHQVIQAISEAGYPAKPLVEEPESCALPETSIQTPVTLPTSSGAYRIQIDDMTCASCVGQVEKAILAVENVESASVNLVEGIAVVSGGEPGHIVNVIIDSGYPARQLIKTTHQTLRLAFSGDVPISHYLRERLIQIDAKAKLIHESQRRFDLETSAHPATVLATLQASGYTATLLEPVDTDEAQAGLRESDEIRLSWRRAWLAGIVGAGLMIGSMSGLLPTFDSSTGSRMLWGALALLCLFTLFYSGGQYYLGAWKQARHLRANMDTLIALGTGAAWLSSVMLLIWPDLIPGRKHLYLDTSVLILAFLQFGHALETRAKGKTRDAIRALTDLTPASSKLVIDDKEFEIPVAYLRIGDTIKIRPGDKIPIDSAVESGQSTVDEAMLSGEPVPVAKQTGDSLFAGTINSNGAMLARVTHQSEDTALAHIIQRVKEAQASKPPIGRIVDKIAAVFVPIVLLIAAITFLIWFNFGPDPRTGFALTASIAVLVIACPCALGLATPIAIMVGTGRAAQAGILIRNGDALQAASTLTHLVVDKTGTLTKGKPAVTGKQAFTINEHRLLQLATSLEVNSEHPLANAIIQAADKGDINALPVESFSAITGRGVQGTIEHIFYRLGNAHFMTENSIEIEQAATTVSNNPAATPVYLADETKLLGVLLLEDPIRESSLNAIQRLQASDVEVVMCSGDNAHTVQTVAKQLGITQVHSEVLPEQKAEIVQRLQQQGFHVGMAGDGINDAPALAQANVGFAVGAGTDVAIENADITLANNSLDSISTAITLSRATIRNIKQNLFGAFIYNVLGIPLAAGVLYPATGLLLSPVLASIAMALSSVTVVTNANRLRFINLGAPPQ
jgi:Cu+-exporting ATPase